MRPKQNISFWAHRMRNQIGDADMEKQEKTEKIVSKKTLEGANAAAQLLLEKHRQYDSVSVGPHGGLKAKQDRKSVV